MVYDFSEFSLDEKRRELRLKGREVVLQPRVFDLLVYLVRNRERVVSKGELLDALWPRVIVTEGSLQRAVSLLRSALREGGAEDSIRTYERQGYRFCAELVRDEQRAFSDPPLSLRPKANEVGSGRSKDTAIKPDDRLPFNYRPAIAVLPFANISGDADQEYFADGLTEDITTALARNRSLVVIAWHSAFAYKGKAIDIRQIADELGCRYVVEGTVRRTNQRVRINAHLVEADTGNHLWAERYERQLEDIFAVQDEIARNIAGAIDPELSASESKRARAKAPENLDAWDYYQQGLWHLYKFTIEGLAVAKSLLERAIELDENFAPPYARLSYVHIQHAWYGPHRSRDHSLGEAIACAKRAVELDDKDALGHFALGRVYALQHRHDMAVAELETAIDLNPSFAQAYFALAQALVFADRIDEALPLFEQAIRLSPHDPHMWTFLHMKGMAYYRVGQLDEAEYCVTQSVRQPNATHWPFATLVSIRGQESKFSDARAVLGELLQRRPQYSCAYARDDFVFEGRPFLNDEFVELYVDGLRRAGLPE